MSEEERDLPIVIVGHVDHGKSTLIGRLLYDTGCLPPDKFSEIERSSEMLGRRVEYAFAMDCLEEERSRGITIDTTQTFFRTKKRRYVIIDAPGHKEFLKNMITGSSQAEAALIVIDALEGIRDQTKRHAYILGMLGLKQICVLLNKIDLIQYSEKKFSELKESVKGFLEAIHIRPTYILPISAITGENVAAPSIKIPWFNGLTVLEALDTFEPLKVEEKPLRFPFQDVYRTDGKEIIVGRVEAGHLTKGGSFFLLPEKKNVIVKSIEKFLSPNLTDAGYGESVGICLNGKHRIRRGQVLAGDLSSLISDRIRSNVIWMSPIPYQLGDPLLFRCATQELPCRIEKIYEKFDPASMELIEEAPSSIADAQVANVLIRLGKEGVMDFFDNIPEMGRFVLEKDGRPVAGGIILEEQIAQ